MSRWSVVRGSDETDARKKEYGAKNKIDQDLFYIFHSSTALHKIDGAKDQPSNAEESQNNTDNPFFHCRF